MAGFRVRRSPYMKLGPVRVRRGIVYHAAREADQRQRATRKTTRTTTSNPATRATAPRSTAQLASSFSAAPVIAAQSRTWLQRTWYQTETAETKSWAYTTSTAAEEDRSAARAWGWESAPPHLQWKRASNANSQPKQEFVVTYTRTPSAAAAAKVKHHWEQANQAAVGLSGAQERITTTLTTVQVAVAAARTTEGNPIALETRARTALQELARACAALAQKRDQLATHYDATHHAHTGITAMTSVIHEMHIPSVDAVTQRIQQHRAGDTQERGQAESVAPALAAQEQVVSAAQQWQAAVRKRWLAQRAYLPVEHWWERLLVRLEAKPRPIPAVAVTREAVLTQVLHADEVGPDDAEWREAEAEVATTEAALLDAIAARDAALAEVAQAFTVTL